MIFCIRTKTVISPREGIIFPCKKLRSDHERYRHFQHGGTPYESIYGISGPSGASRISGISSVRKSRGAPPSDPFDNGGAANYSADRINTSSSETNRVYAQNVEDTTRTRKAAGSATEFGDVLMEALAGVNAQPEKRKVTRYENDKDMEKIRTEAGVDKKTALSVDALEAYYDMDEKHDYRFNTMTENNTLADGGGLSVTSKQGTDIRVQRASTEKDGQASDIYLAGVTRSNGVQYSFEFNENVRINDSEDGTLTVYYADSGETHTFDAQGTRTITQGKAGSLSGTDGDDILINLNGNSVDGGSGDDTIINFADDAELNGGDGNDTVLLAKNVRGNRIDMGNGDDRVMGLYAQDSEINMGDGDDTVGLQMFRNTKIDLGSGDNKATVGYGWGGEIVAENGNNKLKSFSLSGQIDLGDGNNTLEAHSLGGSITLGDGNNSIKSFVLLDNLNLGDGNNTLDVHSLEGQVNLGDGNNTVAVGSISNYEMTTSDDDNLSASASRYITAGNGNNTVQVGSLGGAGIELGDGDNDVYVRSIGKNSIVEVGDGNNGFKAGNIDRGNVTLGDGNNVVFANCVSDFGGDNGITVGNGNNTFAIGRIHGGNVAMGHGDNTLLTDSVAWGATIAAGNGNNTVGISHSWGANLLFGSGVNTIGIFSGNLDIKGGPHTNAYFDRLADSDYQLPEHARQAHDETTRRQDVADMMTKLREQMDDFLGKFRTHT